MENITYGGRREFILGTLLLGLCVVGCGPSASAHNTTLRIPVYGRAPAMDPGIFDPARATTSTPLYLASLLSSGLVKFGPDLHVIPELAVSLPTISSTGKSYTFTIRQDARFADGRHCTAADVAYSLARALSPAIDSTLARSYLGGIRGADEVENGRSDSISGVAEIGRLTVRIDLVHPDATFLQKLAFPIAAIVERRRSGNMPALLGPWSVAARESDGSVILLPRRNFYGGSVQVNAIRLVPVSDQARGVALFKKGELDLARVPDEQYAQLSVRADFHSSEALDAYYALPQGPGGPRLASTLDRDHLLDTFSPQLSPLVSIVPPAIPDYAGSSEGASGIAVGDMPGARIRLSARADPLARALSAALRRQWTEKSGVPTPIRVIHVTYQLPDPGRWLRTTLPQTNSRWFRGLLSQANELTNDPVTRMNLYGAGESWALQKGLVIPLATGSVAFLIRPSVQNLQVTPSGIMPENNNWSLVNES